jgi:hypothetical protein
MFLIKFIKSHRVAVQQSVYLSAVQLSPSWRAVAEEKTVKSNHSSMRDVTCAAAVVTTLTDVTYTFCLYLLGRSRLCQCLFRVRDAVHIAAWRPTIRNVFRGFPKSLQPNSTLNLATTTSSHPFQLVHRSFHRLTLCTLNYWQRR